MTMKLTRRAFGVLSAATAASLAFPGASLGREASYANPDLLVEPEALMARISTVSSPGADDLVVIDVREREAFESGHIAGARQLDPNAVASQHSPVEGSLRPIAEIETLFGDLGIAADRQVVLYDDRGGFHAARMFWLMEYLGHQNVALLNGGFTAWTQQAGPVEQGGEQRSREPVIFQSAVSPRRFASADDVLALRNSDAAVLIDVRPTSMYEEGRIPWAQNIPWAMNLEDDGRFLSADALRGHFEGQGVTPDLAVTLHCQVGLASSHSYVALRLLGYPQVRVYHRSWAEWGADPSLPKIVS